jgi:hypothetical protein
MSTTAKLPDWYYRVEKLRSRRRRERRRLGYDSEDDGIYRDSDFDEDLQIQATLTVTTKISKRMVDATGTLQRITMT